MGLVCGEIYSPSWESWFYFLLISETHPAYEFKTLLLPLVHELLLAFIHPAGVCRAGGIHVGLLLKWVTYFMVSLPPHGNTEAPSEYMEGFCTPHHFAISVYISFPCVFVLWNTFFFSWQLLFIKKPWTWYYKSSPTHWMRQLLCKCIAVYTVSGHNLHLPNCTAEMTALLSVLSKAFFECYLIILQALIDFSSWSARMIGKYHLFPFYKWTIKG